MSKVVRIIVGVGLAVAGVVTGNFQLVYAGATMAGGALFGPKAKGSKDRAAAAATLQVGEVPRQAVVGRAAVAGSLVDAFNFGGQYGTDWEVLILALADHRCDALEGFYVGDTYVPFAADGAVAGYNGQLEVHWRSGLENQDLPAIVLANGPGWTADDRGRGVAYVVVAYKADEAEAKNPVWTGGRPQFKWVLRGLRCYDPRKDSSVGGAGTHRWADPATWQWTDNTIVCRYNWVRGIYACDRNSQPAQLLIGRGLGAIEAPPANVFPRANLCDEIVNGAKRYRAGGVIDASESFVAVEGDFAAACAGVISQPEGSVEIEPGEARAPVAHFTDADLIVGSNASWSDMPSAGDSEWINTAVATFVDPEQGWKERSAPVRRDVADIIADREPREAQMRLSLVQWAEQAGRTAEISRRFGRLWGRTQVTLPPRFCGIEEGDWVTWQSDRHFGGLTFTFRVEAWSSEQNWHHGLTLRQISTSVYSDTVPLTDGSEAYNQPSRPPIAAPSVGSWTLAGEMLTSGGLLSPSLVITGAQDDRSARFVRMRYYRGLAAPTPLSAWVDLGVTGPDVKRREFPVAEGGTFWASVSYVVDDQEGEALILGPIFLAGLSYGDGTELENARAALEASVEDALAAAAARGRLFFRTVAPSASESAVGDTWIDDAGVFYDRIGGAIMLDGAILEIGGFAPTLYWTPSPSQPLAATIATANKAYESANDAIDQLIGLANDGSLSINEKITKLVPEQARLEAKWGILSANAAVLDIDIAAATAKRAAWLAMLGAITPAWDDISVDSPVVREDYDTARDEFDAALYDLDVAVDGYAIGLANTAQARADEAYELANDAIDQLIGLADEGVLTINEKITKLGPLNAELEARWVALSTFAATVLVSPAAAGVKRTAWNDLLDDITPAWDDTSADSPVVRLDYDTARDEYDAALLALDSAIKERLGTIADWSGVTGVGKPEDGATRNEWKGVYNATATYQKGDGVLFDTAVGGNSKGYVRIGAGPTTGISPYDGAAWAIYVDRGATGAAGAAGASGVDGVDGEDGKLIEFVWRRAATQPATPTGNGIPAGWSDDPPAGSTPLWMSKAKQELDGTLVSGESWSTPVRHDGPTGAQGTTGATGAAGPQGPSLFTWIAYANNATGTSGFTTGASSGQTYIGIANNKSSAVEGTNPADYTWSLIKGSDGVPGTPGADGQPTYTWFAYANNATGTSGFTTGAPSGHLYLGLAANKTTATESTNPADYTWSLIKGADGLDGVDGVDGADGKLIEFVWRRAATIPATPAGNGIPAGWSDNPPAGSDPLWMSVVKQELDGTLVSGESWSTPIRHDGPTGATGATGAAGAGGQTKVIWKTQTAAPATPAASAGVPAGWVDDPATLTGDLPRWLSIGLKNGGVANFIWQTPQVGAAGDARIWEAIESDGTIAPGQVTTTSIAAEATFKRSNAILASSYALPASGWSLPPVALEVEHMRALSTSIVEVTVSGTIASLNDLSGQAFVYYAIRTGGVWGAWQHINVPRLGFWPGDAGPQISDWFFIATSDGNTDEARDISRTFFLPTGVSDLDVKFGLALSKTGIWASQDMYLLGGATIIVREYKR